MFLIFELLISFSFLLAKYFFDFLEKVGCFCYDMWQVTKPNCHPIREYKTFNVQAKWVNEFIFLSKEEEGTTWLGFYHVIPSISSLWRLHEKEKMIEKDKKEQGSSGVRALYNSKHVNKFLLFSLFPFVRFLFSLFFKSEVSPKIVWFLSKLADIGQNSLIAAKI